MKSSQVFLEASNSSWKYKSAAQYDKYYAGGDKSVYHCLYNNKITSHDRHIMQRSIYKIARSKDVINIMDFGCGNGRHHIIYKEIAENLAKDNKTINLTAYEISKIALEYYISVLLNLGFSEVEKDYHEIHKNKIIRVLTKDNMTVRFFHVTDEDSLSEIAFLLGDIDITVCMFGVISHIQTRVARQNILAFLSKITKEQLIITFPGARVLSREQQAFQTLRDSKFLIQINGQDLNLEDGDLLYSRNINGVHIENFFHIYKTIKEIREDVRQANLNAQFIGIYKILKEAMLLKHPILSMIDEYISNILTYLLPDKIKEKVVSYYVVLAQKNTGL